ncbi:MAG: Excinuclease abc c subunit domain protein [Parcubacteria group bacterium GW2011_GWA2_39_18]|nr:MAG: Excinuclease abc c subunit domain protein [Parcubacteria group bacterium GW2011_GWA2_39_18]
MAERPIARDCPAKRGPAPPRKRGWRDKSLLKTMYYVYILKSLTRERFYIGHTENIINRLKQHNNKKVLSTKGYIPWKVIYTENFDTRNNAYKRELQIKKFKSGILFRKLLTRGTQVDNENRL